MPKSKRLTCTRSRLWNRWNSSNKICKKWRRPLQNRFLAQLPKKWTKACTNYSKYSRKTPITTKTNFAQSRTAAAGTAPGLHSGPISRKNTPNHHPRTQNHSPDNPITTTYLFTYYTTSIIKPAITLKLSSNTTSASNHTKFLAVELKLLAIEMWRKPGLPKQKTHYRWLKAGNQHNAVK